MPQISLYIDKETLEQVEILAKTDQVSISKWVGNNIKDLIKHRYPKDFFALHGSIDDESFQKPASLNPHDDVRQESL